jgi:hypothetical protein
MGTVLTLDDWWDGPLWGMATYGNQTCIFERVFSEEIDDYLDQYYLTPVSDEQRQQILENWREWLHWMAFDHSPKHAEQWHNSGRHLSLENIAKSSSNYRRYTKCAKFCGERPQNFYSPINNYYVIWQ